MYESEVTERLVRRLRRERIFAEPTAGQRRRWGVEEVERCIPHRAPMRLIDGVDAIDLEGARIRARRELAMGALGLEGHFPGAPIYPGVLQIEMVGQAGLCLLWHLRGGEPPVDVRVVRVAHASFVAPVRPGEPLTVEGARIDDDPLIGTLAGQVWGATELKSTCIVEVFHVAP